MTHIKFKIRPVWHETDIVIDGRPCLVSERPACLLLRLKGTRSTLMLPWGVAFIKAAMLRAEAQVKSKVGRRRRSVTRGTL
jgi:hypothetical protein